MEEPNYDYKATPCDFPDDDGVFHCPYEGEGSESDRCRVFCGLSVDE